MLETALAFTAATTGFDSDASTGCGNNGTYGYRSPSKLRRETPWSSTRCIEMHFGINMHFPCENRRRQKRTKRDKRGGTIRGRMLGEMVVLRKIARGGFLFQIKRKREKGEKEREVDKERLTMTKKVREESMCSMFVRACMKERYKDRWKEREREKEVFRCVFRAK